MNVGLEEEEDSLLSRVFSELSFASQYIFARERGRCLSPGLLAFDLVCIVCSSYPSLFSSRFGASLVRRGFCSFLSSLSLSLSFCSFKVLYFVFKPRAKRERRTVLLSLSLSLSFLAVSSFFFLSSLCIAGWRRSLYQFSSCYDVSRSFVLESSFFVAFFSSPERS